MINMDGIRCAMFEPDGGFVDPSGVTHAYAAGARARGAEIHRFTPVTATVQRDDGGWDVETPNGIDSNTSPRQRGWPMGTRGREAGRVGTPASADGASVLCD